MTSDGIIILAGICIPVVVIMLLVFLDGIYTIIQLRRRK